MWYNPQCLSEQYNGALYFSKVAKLSQSDIVGKTPFMYGLASCVVHLDNGNVHGGCFIMPDFTYIYALVDPDSMEIKYVGKANYPSDRLSSHISYARNTNHVSRKDTWIRELLLSEKRPIMEILSCVDVPSWETAEKGWISYLRSIDCDLFNLFAGGNGITNLSEETKRMIGISNRGKIKSEEQREKLRQANLGKKASPEARAKMSAARKGVKFSDEWRHNISLGCMGNKKCLGRIPSLSQRKKVYNASCKLTQEEVKEIRELLKTGMRQKDIGKKFGVCQSTISHLNVGTTHGTNYEDICD